MYYHKSTLKFCPIKYLRRATSGLWIYARNLGSGFCDYTTKLTRHGQLFKYQSCSSFATRFFFFCNQQWGPQRGTTHMKCIKWSRRCNSKNLRAVWIQKKNQSRTQMTYIPRTSHFESGILESLPTRCDWGSPNKNLNTGRDWTWWEIASNVFPIPPSLLYIGPHTTFHYWLLFPPLPLSWHVLVYSVNSRTRFFSAKPRSYTRACGQRSLHATTEPCREA